MTITNGSSQIQNEHSSQQRRHNTTGTIPTRRPRRTIARKTMDPQHAQNYGTPITVENKTLPYEYYFKTSKVSPTTRQERTMSITSRTCEIYRWILQAYRRRTQHGSINFFATVLEVVHARQATALLNSVLVVQHLQLTPSPLTKRFQRAGQLLSA